MLEQYLQEYETVFNEQFPLMLCRGCDDDEIIVTINDMDVTIVTDYYYNTQQLTIG